MNWIQKLFGFGSPAQVDFFTGALPDNRPESEKKNDIQFSSIVASANAAVWNSLDINKLPDWPVLNQGLTSSCVAASKALMTSIVYFLRTGVFVQFSFKWIYSHRKNAGYQGMIGVDAFDIESAVGIIPEAMVPSVGLTEAEITSYTAQAWENEVGKALRMSDQRIVLPTGDIEVLASVAQTTGKPIMVWFNWFYDEWTQMVPKVLRTMPPYNHSVTHIPPRLPGQNSIGIYEGEKTIVIQDSWGLNNGTMDGKRIIKESFYKERNLFAAYSMRFRFDEKNGPTPVYDGTIISVQKCLQYEGCFPMNVSFVENLGPVTKKSLAQFQLKHNLPVTSALDAGTVALLKQLYSK